MAHTSERSGVGLETWCSNEGTERVSVAGSSKSVTLPYRDVMQILSFVTFKSTDVFVDLGCGLGECYVALPFFEYVR